MMRRFFKRTLGWLPATLVLAVVLVAGTRLIALSMQQHAERSREAAGAAAAQLATGITRQLQGVTDEARRQAAHALAGDAAPELTAVPPVRNGFWMSADGAALPAENTATTIAHSIASEWASLPARGALPKPTMLGPMREGSQWIIA